MIIRHIPMKKARLSSFSSLVRYLCDEQNKEERVGKISLSNCNSEDPAWAVQEVLATQAKNQRAIGDKTYHLLISFAQGEQPAPEILKIIEERVAASIGFAEHQRISVVHHDTDNLHIHLAINKIHPKTYNLIEPFRAYKTFATVAVQLEKEFGLQITNHQTRKSRSENLADDMEQHSGLESLINWIKRNCKEKLEAANDWKEVHKVLARHGLSIHIRANGFVFRDTDGLTVKASSISRQFSKQNFETRLGEFEPLLAIDHLSAQVYKYEPLNKEVIGKEIYARYLLEKEQGKGLRKEKLQILRTAKARLIDKAKKHARLKRAALKLMSMPRVQKKLLYQQISKTLLSELAKIRANHSKEHQRLLETYQSKVWADWLKLKAEQGDCEALTALRYRNRKNQSAYSFSGANADIPLTELKQIDSITKEGTEIYKFDQAVIRNNGREIKIAKGGTIESLKKALKLARQQYGNCIKVKGSPLFKKIIVQITALNNIPITFADSEMETARQKLILETEKYDEQPNKRGFNVGRRAPRGHETVGTARGRRKARAKSNAFSFRQSPPAKDHNGLRGLSKCSLVQLTRRGQVLLQNHAPDQLEQHRYKSDNYVRWEIFGLKSFFTQAYSRSRKS